MFQEHQIGDTHAFRTKYERKCSSSCSSSSWTWLFPATATSTSKKCLSLKRLLNAREAKYTKYMIGISYLEVVRDRLKVEVHRCVAVEFLVSKICRKLIMCQHKYRHSKLLSSTYITSLQNKGLSQCSPTHSVWCLCTLFPGKCSDFQYSISPHWSLLLLRLLFCVL